MENKKREIAEFYKQIFSDIKLKERIVKKVKKIATEEDLKNLIQQEIVPLMKKYNVNFSEEELLEYEEETLKKLSKEDLDNVSGGTLIKPVAIGALSALALACGVGVASLSASADSGKGALVQNAGNGQQQSDSNEEEEEEEANISENDNDEAYQIIANGNCGPEGNEESVRWEFFDNGTLEIWGIGSMKDFSPTDPPPWRRHKDKIRNITMSTTHIGSYAFTGCSEVTSVYIAPNVTSTGKYAFANCTKLNHVFFEGKKDLDPNNDKKVFANCPIKKTKVTDAYIDGNTFCGQKVDFFRIPIMPMPISDLRMAGEPFGVPTVHIYDLGMADEPFGVPPKVSPTKMPLDKIIAGDLESEGVLWVLRKSGKLEIFGHGLMKNYSDKERPQWEQYKDKIKWVNISGVKSIGDNAFANYNELRLLEISNDVVSIGKNAFNDCNNLSVSVVIPVSVTSIGENAFANCTKLNYVFFEGKKDLDPNNDKKIFANCPIEKIKVTDDYTGGNTFCGKRAIKMKSEADR